MELGVPIIELHTLEWICIGVQVQDTWGPNHPSMDHTFELKNEPKIESWFIKLDLFSYLGPLRVGGKAQGHNFLSSCLGHGPSCDFFGSKNASHK